jgi:hypothetical protein
LHKKARDAPTLLRLLFGMAAAAAAATAVLGASAASDVPLQLSYNDQYV